MKRALEVTGAVVVWGISEAVFFTIAVREAYWSRRTYGWPYQGRGSK